MNYGLDFLIGLTGFLWVAYFTLRKRNLELGVPLPIYAPMMFWANVFLTTCLLLAFVDDVTRVT